MRLSGTIGLSRKMWVCVLFLASFTFATAFQQELIPDAPNITAFAESCKSILVSWNAVSFNGRQLDTYEVFYKENSSNSQEMIRINGSEASLSGLEGSTSYIISVAAVSLDNVVGATSQIQRRTFGAVRGSNLQVNEVTNHSAIFSWEISHPNIGCNGKLIDHDTQFRVRYKEVDDSESWRRINLKNTSAKLPNLLPFTNYTVYVLTADQSGPNQKSDDLFFTTLPGVPSAPINVKTVTNNSIPTRLLIRWQEPLELNGVISHYDVEFGEQGSQSQIASTSNKELLLNGLNPSGMYNVRVRANNHAQLDRNEPGLIPGAFTDITSIRLPDPLPVPPGHPRDFKVTHKVLYGTNIELHFSWKPPSTGDPVDEYRIKCNKSVVGSNSTVALPIMRIKLPTLHLVKETDGDPFTSYQCHSYASNEVGDGPVSRTISIPPIPLASSEVHQLMAEALNYTHVNLSWSKPNSRNEYITSYFVTMRDNSAETVTNFTVTAPDTSLMVEALTGNTLYNFDVVAISVFIGEQLISNVTSTHVTTPTGDPSYPRDVDIEIIDSATVQVHWSPPIPTNGIIIRYRVNAEIKSVYSTQNGEREFSHSFKKDVHDHYFNTPLLTPGTNYQFNVTAYTSEGSGPTTSVNATLNKGRIDAVTYFQLRLRPFSDCSKSQDDATKQDIKNQLIRGLEEECACVLDPDVTITDIQTQCNPEDSHLIYIGRIIGTKDLRPLVLLDLLKDWTNKDTSVLQAAGESMMVDQSCPLYLSSPRDRNCVPEMDPPTPNPTTGTDPQPSSSSVPSTIPQPTSNAEELQDSDNDDETNIPILIGCFIGGVFIGCLITLCILISVFCCHIQKRRKKEDIEEAIYARPSRRNKRIKVTAVNGEKNPLNINAYTSDINNGKESDYAIPRKRSGSIDSVDLHMHRTESKMGGVTNPLPCSPSLRPTYTPPPPPPPAYDHNTLYSSPTKQAKSLDNLSSYTHGNAANGGNDALYQSPRYPSLSVDDLLNGIPSRKFHYTFSPLHKSARSPTALPRTPKDTYDDPRTSTKAVAIGDSTYDTPRNHTQPGTNKPLPINGVGPSPKSVPQTPHDTYDDPRRPSAAVTAINPTYDSPKNLELPETPTMNNVRASPRSMPRTPKDAYDDPQRPSATVAASNPSYYDSPKNLYNQELPGTPTKPVIMDNVHSSPKSVSRTPNDTYDDPRKPTVASVNNSPGKPYDYVQLANPQKPKIVDDDDDPDYSYVE